MTIVSDPGVRLARCLLVLVWAGAGVLMLLGWVAVAQALPPIAPADSGILSSPPAAPAPLTPLPLTQAVPLQVHPGGKATSPGGEGLQRFGWPLLLAALAVALGLFFTRRFFRRQKRSLSPQTKQPQAYLDDHDRVAGHKADRIAIEKERVTIGRGPGNDVCIDEPTISSLHATIECQGGIYYLEDQRSTNGCKLNDRKLGSNRPVRLKSGDRIQLATFAFTFVMPDRVPFGQTVMFSTTALGDAQGDATVIIDTDGADGRQELISCMQSHLLQLYGLGAKYREFAGTYFAYDMVNKITAAAHDLLTDQAADRAHCSPIIEQKAFYLVCGLPGPFHEAADWYKSHHGGYIRFIMQWLQSDAFRSAGCDVLCVTTFGQDPATWVSLTIVPIHQEPDPVEIMSVDFLNDSEKAMLGLAFDDHGRVI